MHTNIMRAVRARTLAGATLGLIMGIAGPATGQEALVIPRVERGATLDGQLDPAEWADAVELPLVGYLPTAGAPPSESTVVRIMHDGISIYVAAALHDRERDGIQDWSRGRDDDQGGDFINVLIDAYGDRESAVVFSTTPAGARLDYAISNDAEGPNPSSISWNGFWDVRVRRDASGWFAEFRIPFSTLRYQAHGDEVRMGLIVNRLIGRKSERVIFPAIEPRWSFGMFKPSRARPVVFRGIDAHRQRIVVPYLTAGDERAGRPELAVGGAPRRDTRWDAGGDLKIALSHNVNLDATVNTDFAETEADDQQLNLGRFPIAHPERRQFFLERASVFDFSFSGDNNLLNTRRIGLTSDGERVPLYGGVRVVGRVGGTDIGLLDMQTRAAAGEGSTNFGVLRLRSRVLNDQSFVGAMATTRVSPDARDGAAGVDAMLRLGGPHFLRLAAVMVDAPDVTSDPSAPDAHPSVRDRMGLHARLERRSTVGFGGSFGVFDFGTAFAPPVGFVESSGIRRLGGRASYGFPGPEGRSLRLVTPALMLRHATDLAAGTLQTEMVVGEIVAELRSGAMYAVVADQRREVIHDTLRFADAFRVPPGDYDFTTLAVRASSSPSAAGSVTAQLSAGDFYDGHRTTGTLSGIWHPAPPVTASVDYVHEQLSRAGSAATLRLIRLRASVAPSARHAGAATVQHSTAAHVTRISARWRINFREATDLWLVYDHALNTARDRTTPSLPRLAGRSLLVKLTYAIEP